MPLGCCCLSSHKPFPQTSLGVRMRSSRKWNKSNLQDGTGERFGWNGWGPGARSQPAGGSSKVPHLMMLHDCSGTRGTPHLWEFATKMLSQRTLNMALWEPRLNNSPLFYPLNIMCPANSFNSKFDWFNGLLFSGTALTRHRKVRMVRIQCADILNYVTMMSSPTSHDEAQRTKIMSWMMLTIYVVFF